MCKEMLLEVRHLSAGYEKKQVIHDVSFTLESHTLTALLGANGCGKSTLMKSIANQLRHEGSCILQGEEMEALSVRKIAKKVSYMPQRSGISVSLPVLDVVLMGFNPTLRLLERPSEEHKKRALEALKKVGLSGFEELDYLTLSEGQKQLVFLARTIIEDTSLLLLDEPDSALDFPNRHIILRMLKEIVQHGDKAGLLCLHDPSLALEYCQRLLLMKAGRCIQVLEPGRDSVQVMEEALRRIYGRVSLLECDTKDGKRHFMLVWEEDKE